MFLKDTLKMLKRFLLKTLNQFVLSTPAGMPTESPCSSALRAVPPHPDPHPLLTEPHCELQAKGLHPWLSSDFLPSHHPSLLPFAHL